MPSPLRGRRLGPSALMLRVLGLLSLLGMLCACEPAEPLCSADALRESLDQAAPGSSVLLGACEIHGDFDVPEGVTLEGAGTEATRIVGSGTRPTLSLAADVVVEKLSVRSPSDVALRYEGEGALRLSDVQVQIERGAGVLIQNAQSVSLQRVSIRGPVSEADAHLIPAAAGLEDGSFGLVLLSVGTATAPAQLEDVEIQDVGPWGGLVANSYVRWAGGSIAGCVGTGLYIGGGEASLEDLTITDSYQGIQVHPAYGAVFTADASVTSSGLTIVGGDGIGILQDEARAEHVDLMASEHRFGGVWVQRSAHFELHGAGTRIVNNAVVGLSLIDNANVVVTDATIENTAEGRTIEGELVRVLVGDGIHFQGTGSASFTGVSLAGHARVGLLADVGAGTTEALVIAGLEVDAASDALGAIAQDASGVVASGTWDAEVTRTGGALVNDALLEAPLSVAEALAGGNVPTPSTGAL